MAPPKHGAVSRASTILRDDEGTGYASGHPPPRVHPQPQPLCLTPPSSSMLSSETGSACISPFELDKRPRSSSSHDVENDTDSFNKNPTDDGQGDEVLTSKQESEYNAFVNTLLV